MLSSIALEQWKQVKENHKVKYNFIFVLLDVSIAKKMVVTLLQFGHRLTQTQQRHPLMQYAKRNSHHCIIF